MLRLMKRIQQVQRVEKFGHHCATQESTRVL